MAVIVLHMSGENQMDVVDEEELFIAKTYKGEMARRLAMNKLQNNLLDEQKTAG